MAGESPDRSKQHESSASSAEPTPGTPATVPGPARGTASASTPAPAPASADPRMAVARERAATVRVDQATAVFSTKALAEAERSVEEAEGASTPEGSPEAGASSGPAEPAEASSAGDARLRAVVAAWVAGADDAEPEAGADAGSDSGAGSESADDVADADSDADGDSGGSGPESDAAAGGAASTADVEDDRDSGASDDASAPDGGGAASAGEQDSASGEASVADESGGEPEAENASQNASKDRTDAGSDPEDEPKSETDDDTSDKGAAAAGPKGAWEESGKEPSEATAQDSAKELSEATAQDSAKEPSEATAQDSAKEPSEATPEDSPKATSADSKDSAAPAPAVDQPTAIFKAPRPPAVDQPTTMLKLGGGTKPTADRAAEKPADKATDKPADRATGKPTEKPTEKPTAKPESDPERTSKFVALKPLDGPASAKPRTTPAPETAEKPTAATAALPQIGPERTAQQPLPPKPPLDLLAELTNTPPRPETPVRTIVRRVKIWTPLVLLLAVIFAVVQAVRPLPAAGLTLTADETYTFQGGTLDLPWPGQGQSAIEVEGVGSLGSDGKQTAAPIASVAKIMTAYVILQEHPLEGNGGGEKITVDQQAEDESKNEDESTAAMSKGQQFTERQMLQMLMIPSGNNAARLLARWDSDNETFVGKMNAAAKRLGMTKTTYTDPSGLEKTTVSTATDQLKLAEAVMQDEVFRSIVGMASAKIPGLDKPIYNNNDLLVQQVGVIGLKTGSSTPAGGNLVWAATTTVNGKTQTIYGAVMGQDAGTGKVWDSLHLALTNSQKLIDKVQKSLTSATVVKKGDAVGYVDDQLGGRTPVVATENMTAVGWPGLKTKLSIGAADGKTVPHSGKAGTVVGELTVGDGSSHAVKIRVALRSDLAEPGFGARLPRVS